MYNLTKMTTPTRGILPLFLLCLFTLPGTSVRAQIAAEIVNVNAAGCLQYESDAMGNFIPDYSYAGYRNGEEAIPNVPTVRTIGPVAGDNTAHIQAAIDEVADLPLNADGLRGAVELSAGLYPVAGRLQINADGVVLRGVGQGEDPLTNTVIRGDGNSPAMRNLITVGGDPFVSWNSEVAGTRSDIISPVVPTGARTVQVANPGMYAVGDNVIVYHPSTNDWLASVNFGDTAEDGPWVSGQLDMVFNRYVEAIDSETGQLTLDVPVYDRLDRSLAQSEIYVLNEPDIRRNSGVENLRVEVSSSGALNEAHIRTAIYLEGVEDAWVSNVTALRFSYAAVDMEVASRVTVTGCSGLTPHSPITGGRRYNFAVNNQSNNVLFTDCIGSEGRHTFVCNAASTGSGIVFHNSTSTGDLSASEGHRRWSQGLLFDNITFTESETFTLIGLYNRGSFGTGHGWSSVNSTAWNVSVPFPRFLVVQKPPGRQNYSVGNKAIITGEGPFVFPIGYDELMNETPLITSIYDTQLAKRLEMGALPDPPASVTAFDFGSRITVNWQDVAADETGYEIFVSEDSGVTFTSLATLPANTGSYDHEVTPTDPEMMRYRVVTLRGVCSSPASGHALITDPPVSTDALFVTYFDQPELTEIVTDNSAGATTTFTLDEACETLQISIADPAGSPLGGFSPYVVRVQDEQGNDITDLTDRVSLSMRVRTAEPVTISALFRSGAGGSDERSGREEFTVPGDTTQWTEFTLEWEAGDLEGFNPADLRDCWFYLDRGEENFNGNEIFFDYIAIGGDVDPERFSPCPLDGGAADDAIFADYFTEDEINSINLNSAAGAVSTFTLDEECETLSISVTDPETAPLPGFNAYQFRATDDNGDPISDISGNVSVTFRARTAALVVVDFLFRSGAGSTSERSARKNVTVPGNPDEWSTFTLTWEEGELEGFDPTDLRDLWFYLDRGDDNFNGNEIFFDHMIIGGEADEMLFSPCSLDEEPSTTFFEYFTADTITGTGLNTNSAAALVSDFGLDTECETLSISVRDSISAPLGGFSAYQIRATDNNGDPITDFSGNVSVSFRARSVAPVEVDFLFRSGEGTTGERSARKSVTVPGNLDAWSTFTLTWEDGDLEGFDPTDLRDLWMYLDRGEENFNGNLFILDHIVIGGEADEMNFSPCLLGDAPGMAFFEYFTADTITETGINLNSAAAVLTDFDLDTECETLSISVQDSVNAPVGGFSPYQLRATDEEGAAINSISGIVSVSFRARSVAPVVVDFQFRSGEGTSDERSGRKSVTVPGNLDEWSTFTLTWEEGELEGFDPTDLRDLWMFLDRGEENFNGNLFVLDHIVIGGEADEARFSPCPLVEVPGTPFFEYLTADTITQTGINVNSAAAVLTDFALDTECETLSISVQDPVNAPVGGFSPYQLRATDDNGAAITNISGIVSVSFRARSLEPVVVDFLFRSGGGATDERSGRKSVTVPGNLEEWSTFTLTWEESELEGFDPTDLRDLWFYLDRGEENFSGNLFILDHIVIGAEADMELNSPCIISSIPEAAGALGVVIYPNPTSGLVSVKTPEGIAFERWQLYDLQGRILGTGRNVAAGIDLGDYPRGVHLLKLDTADGRSVRQRVVVY